MIAAQTVEEVKDAFQDEISSSLLTECGMIGPFQYKKEEILSVLLDYHLMIKMKAEMDQYIEGLEQLGVLVAVRNNPDLFRDFFVYNEVPISAGKTLKIWCTNQCMQFCLYFC